MTRDLPLLFLFPKISQSIACEHSLHTGCTPRTKKVNKIKDFLALCLATGTTERGCCMQFPCICDSLIMCCQTAPLVLYWTKTPSFQNPASLSGGRSSSSRIINVGGRVRAARGNGGDGAGRAAGGPVIPFFGVEKRKCRHGRLSRQPICAIIPMRTFSWRMV